MTEVNDVLCSNQRSRASHNSPDRKIGALGCGVLRGIAQLLLRSYCVDR